MPATEEVHMKLPRSVAKIGVVAVVAGVVLPAGSFALEATGAARGGPPAVHGVNFQIKSLADETYCVETNAGTSTPTVYMQQCTGAGQQRWTFTDGADGTNVVVGDLGMCLGINHKVAKPWPAQISTCNYKSNQRFTLTPIGEIVEVYSLECLTTTSPPVAGGAVFLESCQNPVARQQVWRLIL
jgi:hypothetical protein